MTQKYSMRKHSWQGNNGLCFSLEKRGMLFELKSCWAVHLIRTEKNKDSDNHDNNILALHCDRGSTLCQLLRMTWHDIWDKHKSVESNTFQRFCLQAFLKMKKMNKNNKLSKSKHTPELWKAGKLLFWQNFCGQKVHEFLISQITTFGIWKVCLAN